MNPHIFREYDIRGLVDIDLTDSAVEQIGLGLGTTLRQRGGKRLVLGRDCRVSSGRFRDILARSLCATGCEVLDLGVIPTPLTYFAANTLPVDGLVMITGSHNPAEYNGFKIGIGKTTLRGTEIQELRKLIESGCFVYGQGTLRSWNIINSYNDFIRQDIHLSRQGMKIVIDAGNGVGGHVAVPLFQSLGLEVVPLYCEMDGRFPNHHPDPTIVKNLSPLIDKVIQEKASVGIAYDGDADRIGVVDEKGNILWGDELMILFAKEVLHEEPGATIVGEAKCSMRMYDAIAQHGGRAIMWKAGHSIIKAKMQEENALLGGEMSGHIFWKHRYYGFDDAVYTSARLLEIMSQSNKTLSEMFSDIPPTFATPELHFQIPEEKKFEMVSRTVQFFQQNGYRVIDVDGARVVFPDGWGLVRASNTQPMLVLRFEAHTEERMKEIRALVESVLLDIKNSL